MIENHKDLADVDSSEHQQLEGASEIENDAILTPTEARVLGCLMEKELTVPENYPLTLNALTLACNQKSNREPTMQLEMGEVGRTAKILEQNKWLDIQFGDRADRYKHRTRQQLQLEKSHQALLTVMLLRSPQTLNELKVRTKRMVDFEDEASLLENLSNLIERESPLVQLLPKGLGQREDRFTHLLCGVVEPVPRPKNTREPSQLEQRIAALEQQVESLTTRIDQLTHSDD